MKIYTGKKRAIGEKNEKQEEELFKFDEDDDDDDEDDEDEEIESNAELSASDIEDQQYDDDVPDQKAWGKKRGQFYNADFVDKDYSTYTKEEEDLALAEEEEAQEIQRRLAQQLNDIDCDLELFGVKKVDDVNKILPETKLKVDFSDLDDRQKIQIFKKESPEFEGLINDFETNLKELSEFYTPIIEYTKSKKLNLPIFKILEARVSATNFYLTNLAFYLYMKIRKVQFKGHPLVKKLAQIKQLLTELDSKIENFKMQLNDLLDKIKTEDIVDIVPVGKISRTHKEDSENDLDDENYNSNEDEEEIEHDGEDDEDRRGITYQMAKNKGLTPHRKKENRNPRVKHRNKFRKALIRRKGAVRTVRKEIKRYDGEISGIKATVKKSIKLN